MLFVIHKILDKQVHQITVCKISKALNSELVPGLFFKKLQSSEMMVEIPEDLIIENFAEYEEVIFRAMDSKYFMYKAAGNIEIVLDAVINSNKRIKQSIFTK